MPPFTPVIAPEFTAVATSVLLLVHDKAPDVASVRLVTNPWHTVLVPVIFAGKGFTVSL